jgi:hypothetical protein
MPEARRRSLPVVFLLLVPLLLHLMPTLRRMACPSHIFDIWTPWAWHGSESQVARPSAPPWGILASVVLGVMPLRLARRPQGRPRLTARLKETPRRAEALSQAAPWAASLGNWRRRHARGLAGRMPAGKLPAAATPLRPSRALRAGQKNGKLLFCSPEPNFQPAPHLSQACTRQPTRRRPQHPT